MRHRVKGKILDRERESRGALLKNLAAQVLLYEKVTTTAARAKAVQPLVEKAITIGRVGTLNARRALIRMLPLDGAVRKVLDVLGPKYKDRNGGYTRVLHLATPRRGDAGKRAMIELVQ